MDSKSGQTLTALVMLVPLVVVPAIAVLGLPRNETTVHPLNLDGQDVQRPDHHPDKLKRNEPLSGLSAVPEDPIRVVRPTTSAVSGALDRAWNNPFDAPGLPGSKQPSVTSGGGLTDPRVRAATDGRPRPGSSIAGKRTSLPVNDRAAVSGSPAGAGPDAAVGQVHANTTGIGQSTENLHGVVPGTSVDKPLTWGVAVRRLNELGIKDFRLEGPQSDESYYFIAFHTARGQSAVLRRFEAVSAEPLDAVAGVLSQIEQWLAER